MKYLLSLGILLSTLAFAFIQSKTIKGKVEDENNKAIAGALITVKATGQSTQTDAKGNFSLSVSDEKIILVVSFIGYETKEIEIKKDSSLTITLHSSASALNEVVVNAYAAEKKDITGSIAISERVSGVSVNEPALAPKAKNYANQETEDDWRYNNDFNTEGYDKIIENPFLKVDDNPLSTFSIDVDAASYSNMRRFINNKQLPLAGAIRIEELVNYFSYKYPQPEEGLPFSINPEISVCPWNSKHNLVLVGLQGKIIPADNLPPSNLVFLIDVSGSMMDENKLPLVQSSLKLLTDQ